MNGEAHLLQERSDFQRRIEPDVPDMAECLQFRILVRINELAGIRLPARRSGRALAVAPVIVSVTFDAMRGSLHLSRTASPFQNGSSPEKNWPVLIRSTA